MRKWAIATAASLAVVCSATSSLAQAADAPDAGASDKAPKAEPGSEDYLPFYMIYTQMPNNIGRGPYPAVAVTDPHVPDHVIFRPKDLGAMGDKKLGVVIWGSGGCSVDAGQSRFHLIELASYGYVVVVAGRMLTGPDAPPGSKPEDVFNNPEFTMPEDVSKGLDLILAEARRPGSPYYGKIDPNMIAVSGHSCGSGQAVLVAQDPRVKTLILLSGGAWNNKPDAIPGMTLADHPFLKAVTFGKEELKKLHTPILDVVGGKGDMAYPVAESDFAAINNLPIVMASAPLGHELTFMDQNGGRVAELSVAWLEWQLRGDKKYAPMFVGKDCTLCTDPFWTIRKKQIP